MEVEESQKEKQLERQSEIVAALLTAGGRMGLWGKGCEQPPEAKRHEEGLHPRACGRSAYLQTLVLSQLD